MEHPWMDSQISRLIDAHGVEAFFDTLYAVLGRGTPEDTFAPYLDAVASVINQLDVERTES